MERIKGLNEYVKNEKYRKALNLPNEQEEEYITLWFALSVLPVSFSCNLHFIPTTV